jgi:hypothetical protein
LVRTTRKIWRTSKNASSSWKAISLPWGFVIGRGPNASTQLLIITIQYSKEQAKENAARSPGRRVMVRRRLPQAAPVLALRAAADSSMMDAPVYTPVLPGLQHFKEALMTSNQRLWLYYGLVIAAIMCSLVSLFALVEMGAPRWITSLNILSIVSIFLAMKIRGGSGANDGKID